jgi:hypothetical protein
VTELETFRQAVVSLAIVAVLCAGCVLALVLSGG